MQALKRILYAEDDKDIQQVALLTLETLGGFTVKACDTGLEALEVLEDFEPQLLLLDVMMPGLDGPGVLAEIRQNEAYRNIPVIFMTAKVQTEEVKRYFDLGVNEVIIKPFDPMELPEKIQVVWENAASLND